MPKAAAALAASPKQLAELQTWLRSPSLPSGLAQRARIITLAADGVANSEIAELLGCSRQTVITWRQRFTRSGIAGLTDRPRAGRPPTIDVHKELEIVAVTLAGPAPTSGETHWSTRTLARELGVSNFTIATVWRDHGLKPWRTETFKFSTDPQAGSQDPRRRRAVPAPTREGSGAVRGREVPDPGAGPHRADPAAAAGVGRAAHPRLLPPRHHHAVCRLGGGHRQGDRPLL